MEIVNQYRARAQAVADARTLDLVTAELRVLIDGLSSVRDRLVLRGRVATDDRESLQTALDDVCADNTGEGLLLPPRDLWPLGVKVRSGLVLLPIEVTLERSCDRSTFCYWDEDTYARIHSFREVHTADLRAAGRSIHRLARWKEQVRQRFAARTPVNQWTQQLLAEHLDVLAPGGETVEVAVEVDDDETCICQSGEDTDTDCEAHGWYNHVWRRSRVPLVLVCASDAHLVRPWPSVVRKAWVECVVWACTRASCTGPRRRRFL